MGIEFTDERSISFLVDENKSIVIFPRSKSDGTSIDAIKGGYYVAYYPIELIYPYTAEDLADKIKQGFNEWDKHECYGNYTGRNTFEEKYYGIKGFKNATKGKLNLDIICNNRFLGNKVSLLLPAKRGYAYLGIKSVKLADDADYIDYANAVINLINTDFTSLKSYKVYKSKLNI